MTVTLCILVGLPAVGKTTLVELLREHMSDTNLHVCVVNYDELLPKHIVFHEVATANPCNNVDASKSGLYSKNECCIKHSLPSKSERYESSQQSWKYYRNQVYEFTSETVKWLQGGNIFPENALSRDVNNLCCCFTSKQKRAKSIRHVFFIDDNMFYRSMRYEYFQLARLLECSYCQIFIKGNIQDSINRNSNRIGSIVTEDTIIKMTALLQEPDVVRHTWESNTFVLENRTPFSDELVKDIYKFINKSSENIVSPIVEKNLDILEADRKQCLENLLHQCDQITRKYLSTYMSDCKTKCESKDELQKMGKRLNKKRKEYLNMITTGEISFFDLQNKPFDDVFTERVVEKFRGFLNE
ncbi:L-seryl-tRNA(Sec) kinase-like [Hydractinia symbiolongicarpus]|uniref:L-seryl-tRNA(Sec) kinase-like n=1 Tax=Hydractinia symbiolongicarpus TaxID=13093 RepID=UPI00254F5F78|nr:L-seryl-tRNA(Sec) kinase-like [Hydractinia symbiolongicarpus]